MFETLLNNHELLEKIAATIIGGLSKDAVKDGIMRLSAASKEHLQKLVSSVLPEQKQQLVLTVLDEIPEDEITSENKLISYIKARLSAENYNSVIFQTDSTQSPIITGVVHSEISYTKAQGDIVGTKVINYPTTPEKKNP